ncbi:MAG: MFS transporter [Eubacteriales bacterium]|nr:MFS transporter [Eubacteriales bacterium]
MKTRRTLALIGACLFQCAMIGILTNSNGVFMAAIRAAEGISMTRVSANSSIRSVAGAVMAASLTALFYKADKRKVMAGAIAVVVLGFLLLLIGTDNFLWYVAAFCGCPINSIAVLAIPHAMQKWFPDRSGTASGIAMAFSGIGGAIFNPVAARLCDVVGWRWAIIILSVITVVFAAVGMFLLFGLGEPPVSEKKEAARAETEGVNASVALRFVLITLMILFSSATIMAGYMSIHIEQLGYSLATGALVTSCLMCGNVGGKLLCGWLSDFLGAWKTIAVAAIATGIGSTLLGLVTGSAFVMYPAAFLYGMAYYAITIAIPKCCGAAYGTQLAKKYTGMHVAISTGVGAVLAFAAGPIFDAVGSFTPIFLMITVLCVIAVISALTMEAVSKRAAVSHG